MTIKYIQLSSSWVNSFFSIQFISFIIFCFMFHGFCFFSCCDLLFPIANWHMMLTSTNVNSKMYCIACNCVSINVCYVMLCYVMLCYVMLCYVMLCYVMTQILRINFTHHRPSMMKPNKSISMLYVFLFNLLPTCRIHTYRRTTSLGTGWETSVFKSIPINFKHLNYALISYSKSIRSQPPTKAINDKNIIYKWNTNVWFVQCVAYRYVHCNYNVADFL